MGINTILADSVDKGLINTLTHSITLAANDVLLFRFTFRKAATPATFASFTWNGLPCTMIIDQNSRDVRSLVGFIKAPAGATANLNAFLSNPVKTFAVSKRDTDTTYALPSIAIADLLPSDFVASFLDWLGHDKDYANVISTTAAPALPLAQSDVAQNSNNLNNPGRLYLSSASSINGAQTFSYTRTGAGNAMYNNAIVVLFESLYLINTLTDPLVMGGAYSATFTGFVDGPATLSFSGVSSEHEIVSGATTDVLPGFSDGLLCPFLPATNITVTETQGSNTATIIRSIALPVDWKRVVDASNNPANFFALVTGDAKFIADSFIAAGNPLTTADTCYIPIDSGVTITQEGGVIALAPTTTPFFVHRGSNSRMYVHTLTITEQGTVEINNIIRAETPSAMALAVSSYAISSLALQ
jgi:hypothetical protein